MRRESLESEACEAQEAVLSGSPLHAAARNCDACKAALFYVYIGLLGKAVLECCPEPWIDETRNINGRCRNEIVPVKRQRLWDEDWKSATYQEVRV